MNPQESATASTKGNTGGVTVNGFFYKLLYYRDKGGVERGPIEKELLEALIISGQLNSRTIVRDQNSNQWVEFNFQGATTPSQERIPSNTNSQTSYKSPEKKNDNTGAIISLVVVGGIIGLLILVGLISQNNSGSSRTSSTSSHTTYTPSTTSSPSYSHVAPSQTPRTYSPSS
jgi:hypothetical protein